MLLGEVRAARLDVGRLVSKDTETESESRLVTKVVNERRPDCFLGDISKFGDHDLLLLVLLYHSLQGHHILNLIWHQLRHRLELLVFSKILKSSAAVEPYAVALVVDLLLLALDSVSVLTLICVFALGYLEKYRNSFEFRFLISQVDGPLVLQDAHDIAIR